MPRPPAARGRPRRPPVGVEADQRVLGRLEGLPHALPRSSSASTVAITVSEPALVRGRARRRRCASPARVAVAERQARERVDQHDHVLAASARRLAWPIASSAARTWSRGSWSAGAATISASGSARSHAVTSSGRSSASRTHQLERRCRQAPRRSRAAAWSARARLGQDQHPLAEGERREQIDRAGERARASPSGSRCGGRDGGQVLELGARSPSGSWPFTESTLTSAGGARRGAARGRGR